MGMSISLFGGTLAAGQTVRWNVHYDGRSDEGPVFFNGHPRNPGASIRAKDWSKRWENGVEYRSTLTNTGSQATSYRVQGGRLKDTFIMFVGDEFFITLHGSEDHQRVSVRVRVHTGEDRGVLLIGATNAFQLPLAPEGVWGGDPGPLEIHSTDPGKKRHSDGSVSYVATLWQDSPAPAKFFLECGELTNDPL